MRRELGRRVLVSVVACLAGSAGPAFADQIQFGPAKDNTLYFNPTGALSNGAGSHFFCGKQLGSATRRALMEFDLSAIPAGSTITGVTLRLNMSMTINPAQTCQLRRVLKEWGEGASDAAGEEGGGTNPVPPDATWIHTMMPSVMWATPGGDFAATPTASTSVDGAGFYLWASPQMIADVQGWLDDPSTNHGWGLWGNEGGAGTTKRFDSRENPTPGNRPQLFITYNPPADCPIDYVQDGFIDFLDYLEFLNLYDAQDPLADLNHDGYVDFSDYLEFLNLFDSGC